MGQFNMGGAEAGTLGTPTITCVRAGFLAGLDNPGSWFNGNGDSTIQQIGYFVAPTTGAYVFFITSHDGGDLFLSTDNTQANKHLVAQEAGWSGNWAWNGAGGGGTLDGSARMIEAYASFTSSSLFINLSAGYADMDWTYKGALTGSLTTTSSGLIGSAQAGVAVAGTSRAGTT